MPPLRCFNTGAISLMTFRRRSARPRHYLIDGHGIPIFRRHRRAADYLLSASDFIFPHAQQPMPPRGLGAELGQPTRDFAISFLPHAEIAAADTRHQPGAVAPRYLIIGFIFCFRAAFTGMQALPIAHALMH